MATELFSVIGFFTGWRSQCEAGYKVSATLDDVQIHYVAPTIAAVDRDFYRACRMIFFRRYVPWLDPPPNKIIRYEPDNPE